MNRSFMLYINNSCTIEINYILDFLPEFLTFQIISGLKISRGLNVYLQKATYKCYRFSIYFKQIVDLQGKG